MHQTHVTDHKIDCLQCHLRIEHSLERNKIQQAAANCASCHPNHHHEQVDMLRGVGATAIPAHSSAMVVARAECLTCHRVKEVSSTGTVLWKGSLATSAMCHDLSTVKDLQACHAKLRAALPEIESGIVRARKALASAKLAPDRSAALAAELDSLQHDLDFLRAGNDIHNTHYASSLTRALLERVSALCRVLKTAEPTATLPPPIKLKK